LFKKQALSQAGGGGGGGYAADGGAKKREPSKFMAWNANSFLLRLKSDRDEMLSLLHRLDLDVIAIQVKKNYHLSLSEKICSPFPLSQKIYSPFALWLDKAPPTTSGIHYFSTHTMVQELRRSWCF
jgi:hypothetical protein